MTYQTLVPDWSAISTVLFDMDGTLLDLRFDNHFWQEHLPRRYASHLGVPLEDVRAQLKDRFRAAEGTLNWYCVDHWSGDLGVNIPELKTEVADLIAWRPHARALLQFLRASGKRLVLVTNAHRKIMSMKFERTGLAAEFDLVVCAHDLGFPKEDARFWPRFGEQVALDPVRTLLVDDSVPVLRAARTYGIGHILAIRQPDSGLPDKDCGDFPAIGSFLELLPDAAGNALLHKR